MSEAARLYVILAMRGFSMSKSRLAPALLERERASLNRWLFERTLGVVSDWLGVMQRCLFVSACASALARAADAGARTIAETHGARGHNHAAKLASAHAWALQARRLMLLPCDLPDLTAEALEAFAARSRDADFILAPDKDGTGTNALIVDAAPDLEFFFGEGSLARYSTWARARGWRVALHAVPELAFDLDTPDDLAQWWARAPAAWRPSRVL